LFFISKVQNATSAHEVVASPTTCIHSIHVHVRAPQTVTVSCDLRSSRIDWSRELHFAGTVKCFRMWFDS